MDEFILNIDFMTTQEFCVKYNVPIPQLIRDPDENINIDKSADEFLRIDVVKHRIFVDYAKFLNKDLTLKMFIGDSPLFVNFYKDTDGYGNEILRMHGLNFIFAYLNEKKFEMNFPENAKKVKDMIEIKELMDINYIIL